jgi:hypothetical protein
MIRAASRLTRPGGLLYVDVPNEPHLLSIVGNLLNKLRRSETVFNLSPTWPPYHVFGFNPKALSTLLVKHQFCVIATRTFAKPQVPSSASPGDRIRSWVASQINRVANWTGTASNMYVWAERASPR